MHPEAQGTRFEIKKNCQEGQKLGISFNFALGLSCLSPATLLKKGLWHMCLPVNFAKFLGTSFLT